MNARYEEFTGYTIEECLSIRQWDIIHPDYVEMLKNDSNAILKDKTRTSRQEIKIVTKDGREFMNVLMKHESVHSACKKYPPFLHGNLICLLI